MFNCLVLFTIQVLWLADMISGSSTGQNQRRSMRDSVGSRSSNGTDAVNGFDSVSTSVPPSVISSVPGSSFAANATDVRARSELERDPEMLSTRSSDAGHSPSDISNSVQSVHYAAQSSSIQRLWMRAYSGSGRTPIDRNGVEEEEERKTGVYRRDNITPVIEHQVRGTDDVDVMSYDTPENDDTITSPVVWENDDPSQSAGVRQRRRSNSILELK